MDQESRHLIEIAWTIIANADWKLQSPMWRKSAEMWRDRYYAYLREYKENCEMTVCDEAIELKWW